jgi:hypothetical protein
VFVPSPTDDNATPEFSETPTTISEPATAVLAVVNATVDADAATCVEPRSAPNAIAI